MKTSYLDFVLSTLVICLLSACSVAVIYFFIFPASTSVFRAYHVVFDVLCFFVLYGLFSALCLKALLKVRPLPDGQYEMSTTTFTFWKLLTVVYRLGQGALAPLTPVFFKPLVEKVFGARIGQDVALGGVIDDPYHVEVGDGAVLGHGSLVTANVVYGGQLIVGRVLIERDATVGANAVVMPGCHIGSAALLMSGSVLMTGTEIPAGETWRGNPARKWR